MTTLSNDGAGIDELKRQLQAAATENARLRDRQNASAEILRTIAASPSDARPVFAAIASSSKRLLGGFSATVLQFIGDELHLVAFTPTSPEGDEGLKASFPRRIEDFPTFALVRGGETIQFPDSEASDVPELNRDLARLRGFRSVLFMPLMNSGTAVGMISVTREETGAFAPDLVELLQTFADQAVIAIENARLFNETRETLERQTATADILRVMAASPSDVQPVFDAIAANANRLIGGFSTAVLRYVDGAAHLAAFTPGDPAGDRVLQESFPVPFAQFPAYQLTANGQSAQLPDTELEPAAREIARARGFRSMLFAPLMSEGEAKGVIIATRRTTGAFAEHHVRLLQTFADQAVIAVKNVSLFNATREALERQTATADILKVIAASPADVTPVFQAISNSAKALVGGHSSTVTRVIDGMLHLVAFTTDNEAGNAELLSTFPTPLASSGIHSRVATSGEYAFRSDMQNEPDLTEAMRELARTRGYRSILVIPMLRDGVAIGTIGVTRPEAGPFPDKAISLLRTFADQAVIAIENTRLFNEVQTRTHELTEALEQQTATSEVLSVISRSAGDLAPVFDAMLSKAMRLCAASFGVLNTYDGAHFHTAATYGLPPAYDEYRRQMPLSYGPTTAPARLLKGEAFVEIADLFESDAYRSGEPNRRALVDLGGARCVLAVPLLKDQRVVGNVMIFRQENRPFSEKQIALLQQFAAQAVVAIENTRLLSELRQRTTELSRSLDDLRAAQDRLIQTEKLASLGQLTAGIAHEIKNPLNFVNNFAALSTELTDELNEVLAPVTLGDDVRNDVDELTGMLKDNLQKVVQHGQRADSIVKNMLLHSREGGGEYGLSDVNALVEESLNLAYHGARAEKPQFDVTLKRELDPAAGTAELFPQEISRVLLNLISNGFYAVAKRKAESGAGVFEPVVTATTRDRGDTIEIRIRDNGTGIPDDVKAKMFNPFFTTKPAGEGTGLGLSMSHDIVVKQHGGTIDVATEPGEFTEFTILLPRKSGFADRGG